MEEKFEYTYSAPHREEVRRIREKYMPRPEDGLEKLRRLDKSAERPAQIAAITLGTVGCLVLGTGMSCVMVWADRWFAPGVGIGLLGIVLMALGLPVYRVLLRRGRSRLAPEILALAEALERGL